MAELYDIGIDANRVSVELYENVRIEKIKIKNKVLSTLSLICDGQGAICYMTEDMLTEDYIRWLYTAITRATGHVYLVNWPEEQTENA